MQKTSRAGKSDAECANAGFTLLEMLVMLTVIAMATGIAFASFPRHTSPARITALAHETVAVLTATRTAALLAGEARETTINTQTGKIEGGGRTTQIPDDVKLAVLASDTCKQDKAAIAVVFQQDGSSCGAVIGIGRNDFGFKLRVNWYSGHIQMQKKASP